MKLLKSIVDSGPAALLLYGDSFRRTYTCGHEVAREGCNPVHFGNSAAENALYHSGNIAEGYAFPLAINTALDWAFPNMKPSIKKAAAFALSTATISFVERNDPLDIPAALLGSAMYYAMDRYTERRLKRLSNGVPEPSLINM